MRDLGGSGEQDRHVFRRHFPGDQSSNLKLSIPSGGGDGIYLPTDLIEIFIQTGSSEMFNTNSAALARLWASVRRKRRSVMSVTFSSFLLMRTPVCHWSSRLTSELYVNSWPWVTVSTHLAFLLWQQNCRCSLWFFLPASRAINAMQSASFFPRFSNVFPKFTFIAHGEYLTYNKQFKPTPFSADQF